MSTAVVIRRRGAFAALPGRVRFAVSTAPACRLDAPPHSGASS